MPTTGIKFDSPDASPPPSPASPPPQRVDALRLEERVSISDLEGLSEHLQTLLERLTEAIYQPNSTKRPPEFNAAQLAALCSKSPATLLRLLSRAEKMGLADGVVKTESGNTSAQRRFSLEEARDWVRAVGTKRYKRAEGQPAAVITVGFFKGGQGKTTCATSIAQGLALRGYKVLAIDVDPQGSMTTMLGRNPEAIEIEETIAPIALQPSHPAYRDSLAPSIRQTYYAGLDVISASTGLFACEFYLPVRAMNPSEADRKAGFNFLEVMDKALSRGIRDEYDYVVIDTPPQLGYVTMNAYWAADAILMPIVPEGLSLQSSVQFWTQFTELATTMQARQHARTKEFAWLGVVPSMVEMHKTSNQEMLKRLRIAFSTYLLSSSIPRLEPVRSTSTEFSTVYDVSKYVGTASSFGRAREAFDQLVDEVDSLTRRTHWGVREMEGA